MITFGGGGFEYRRSVRRLVLQGRMSGVFSTTLGITDRKLANYIPEQWNQHCNFIRNSDRGFGFWIWKPLIILKRLSEIPEGDILLYLDSGCELNLHEEKAALRFQDYLHSAVTYGSLAMQMPDIPVRNVYPLEKYYSKKSLLDVMKPSIETLESNQLLAAVIFLKNDRFSREFVNHWLTLATHARYSLLNDNLSSNEITGFKEHRHDQSIFSILYKETGKFFITDETDWKPDWKLSGRDFPIWTMRNRTGISRGNMVIPDKIDNLVLAMNQLRKRLQRAKLIRWKR